MAAAVLFPAGAAGQEVTERREDATRSLPDRDAGGEGPDWQVGTVGEVLVGHDTNPAAGVSPDQKRLPDIARGRPASVTDRNPSGFVQGSARALGEVGRRWFARTRFGWDYRQYFDANRRSQGWLAVDGGWRSPSWATRLTMEVTRYDDTLSVDDAWLLRTDVGAARWVGTHGLIGTHLELGTRRYEGDTADDGLVGGGLHGGYVREGVQLAAGLDVQRRWSDQPEVRRTELVPWAIAGYQWRWLALDLRYESYVRRFEAEDLDGAEHRVRLRGEVRPWEPPVVLVLGVEYGRARGGANAQHYDRFEVFGGLSVQLGWRSRLPSHLQAPPPGQGVATLTEEGVRFRVHRPGATSVAVIGSFNDWSPERGRLEPVGEDGWFEGTLAVPEGRHHYQLLVDGQPERPEGAEAYAPDGFGGENAVLIVR